jgi:hypothetical protein
MNTQTNYTHIGFFFEAHPVKKILLKITQMLDAQTASERERERERCASFNKAVNCYE